jgi:hypothetical protein
MTATSLNCSEYRGFKITPVFRYTGKMEGKADFEYHQIDNEETGGRVFRGDIEQVPSEINEKLNDNDNQD